MSQGLIRAVPTAENQFVNEEEFLAIVIENVYKSARDGAKAVLNHSHAANDVAGGADPDFDTSQGFLDEPDNSSVLKFHANWDTFKKLAKLKINKGGRLQDIIFNPFAEFEKRAQAKKGGKPAAAKGGR